MATVSILDETEMILLPFCTLIPAVSGIIGYIAWKRKVFNVASMSFLLLVSSGIMTGMALFHVLLTIATSGGISGTLDPRFGLSAMGTAFCVCIFLKLHFEFAWVENEALLIDDETNEVVDSILVDSRSYGQVAEDMQNNEHNLKRRRFVAIAVYLVIVFQSAFDGLVLKYNPNGNDSGLQVGMFFLSKVLESIVVLTALLHAPVGRRWYIFYMTSFTVTVGTSTLAAYEIVSPAVPIAIFESVAFQLVLGASGGILLFFSVYFLYIETRRAEITRRGTRWNLVLGAAYVAVFTGAVVSGIFG